MTTARDLMTTELVVLTADMLVHQAMELFLENDISGAPVVDEHGSVVGMLTERDCLDVIYRASYHQDLGATVGESMSPDVESIDAEAELVSVIERFLRSRHRRFPVLDGTHLVGQISRRDVLRAAIEFW